jgi:hypothetical protein
VRGKVWKVFGSPVCSIASDIGLVRVDSLTSQAAARYSFGAFQYETEDEAAGKGLHRVIGCGVNVFAYSCLLQGS